MNSDSDYAITTKNGEFEFVNRRFLRSHLQEAELEKREVGDSPPILQHLVIFEHLLSLVMFRLRFLLQKDPGRRHHTTVYDRHSPLHIAAANGQIQILSMLLDRGVNPDLVNRHKQILKFDSLNGRTCSLHYAAYNYGHSDSLQAILSVAWTSHVAFSWGFARFVNIRDGKGATPLHLAACQKHPDCVHTLLDNGTLVCAFTGGYSFPGSTPLHLAARGVSVDCIRELLAWGADRHQRDSSGRIPHTVALKYKHGACAALLNPSSTEHLVWPSPLKFISELNQEAKALLEQALIEANRERERNILKDTSYSIPSPSHSDAEIDDNMLETSYHAW